MIQRTTLTHFVFVLLALIALTHLPMCSGSSVTPLPDSIDPGEGQISLEAPEVMFYPQDERVNVVTNTTIELYFSVEMDCDSEQWAVLVNGTEYRRSSFVQDPWVGRALVIRPADPFDPATKVIVEARGFLSAAGVPMQDTEIYFTTIKYDKPTVTITPAGSGISPATSVRFEFSQKVDQNNDWVVTIDEETYDKTYQKKSWNDRTLTVTPGTFLDPGTSVNVKAEGFVTVYGGVTVEKTESNFTVNNKSYPSITIEPSNGQTGVNRFAPIKMTFGELVDTASDWTVILNLEPAPSRSPAAVTIPDEHGTVAWVSGALYINHDRPFGAGTTTDVEASGFFAIADQYPFEVYGEKDHCFAVQAFPKIITEPAHDQPNVSLTTKIVFIFDELADEENEWKVRVDVEHLGVTTGRDYTQTDDPGAVTWEVVERLPQTPMRSKLVIDPALGGQTFAEGDRIKVTVTGNFQSDYDGTAFEGVTFGFDTTFISVTDVTVDESLRLVKNTSGQLTAAVTPLNATNPAVTWTTSDPGVATVNSSGLVTAIGHGTATITVTTNDEGKTASCVVEVLAAHFVAVGDDGIIMNSADGRNWSLAVAADPGTLDLHSVAFGNRKYIAVGGNDWRTWSYDGVTWADVVDGYTGHYLHHISFGEDVFIAVGDDGRILRSDNNGETWTGSNIGTNYFAGATYGNGAFMVAGENGSRRISDATGVNWSEEFVDEWKVNNNWLYDVAYGAVGGGTEIFVAIGIRSDPIWASFNGTAWTWNAGACPSCTPCPDCELGGYGSLHGLTYGDGTFVVVGEQGRIIRSADGSTWHESVAPVTGADYLRGAAYANGIFVAVGDNGRRLYSIDKGVTWSPASADGVTTSLRGIGAGPQYNTWEIPAGAITIPMVFVPGGKTFPWGDDTTTKTVENSYLLGETEVTYPQWHAVYTWATDAARGSGRYFFSNMGREGDDGVDGAVPSTGINKPVTAINWRDMMVWCNALTEYYNAHNGLDPDMDCVFYMDESYLTPIRDSKDDDSNSTEMGGDYTTSINPNPGGFDHPYIKALSSGNMEMENCTANGFRLPASREWELAARYKEDKNNDGDMTGAGEYYPYNYASGAYTYYYDTEDRDGNGIPDGKDADDLVAVYGSYYSFAHEWVNTDVSSAAQVKSRRSNALGIYDMAGNVWELCFDWHPMQIDKYRVIRGGSWFRQTPLNPGGIQVAAENWSEVTGAYWHIGFRVAKKP